jgi:cbb3-type cytochrome oxidase cytochrome c subunit
MIPWSDNGCKNSFLVQNITMDVVKKIIPRIFLVGTVFAVAYLLAGCSGMYDGEKLFFQVGCSQCHSFNARGGRMGPDLTAVTNRRSDSWINRYIQNPQKMNPLARMPAFKHLSRAKRKAIIEFLNK